MHARAFTIADAFALVTLFLAACAASDDRASGFQTPISKAQYEQQVEEGFGKIAPLPINWTEPAALASSRVAGHW